MSTDKDKPAPVIHGWTPPLMWDDKTFEMRLVTQADIVEFQRQAEMNKRLVSFAHAIGLQIGVKSNDQTKALQQEQAEVAQAALGNGSV